MQNETHQGAGAQSAGGEGGLERVLNKRDALGLAFGAMIGWGWVVMTQEWIQAAGTLGAMVAFAIGGCIVLLIGLTYAELTSAMPQVGGEHVFSHRALGHAASFICTWAIILGYVSVVAFEAVALPTVLEYLFPNYATHGFLWNVAGWDVYASWVAVGVVASIAMAVVNYLGIKTASLLQLVLTIVIAVAGLALIVGGLVAPAASTANMEPLFKPQYAGIFGVLVMTPFMFVGFDVIPQAAEEINLPFKTIGKVLMLSVAVAVLWYVLIILGVGRALNPSALAETKMGTADAMTALFQSPVAGKLLILAGIAGILTSWNGFFLGASRAIFAMAEGGMLPRPLAKLHPKFKTPTNVVILIGVLSAVAPLFGRKAMVWLVNAGGLGIVLAWLFVALSYLVLRIREPDMPRPFKVKHGKLLGIVTIVLSGALLTLYLPGSKAALLWPWEWGIVGGWAALGVVLAWASRGQQVMMDTGRAAASPQPGATAERAQRVSQKAA